MTTQYWPLIPITINILAGLGYYWIIREERKHKQAPLEPMPPSFYLKEKFLGKYRGKKDSD